MTMGLGGWGGVIGALLGAEATATDNRNKDVTNEQYARTLVANAYNKNIPLPNFALHKSVAGGAFSGGLTGYSAGAGLEKTAAETEAIKKWGDQFGTAPAAGATPMNASAEAGLKSINGGQPPMHAQGQNMTPLHEPVGGPNMSTASSPAIPPPEPPAIYKPKPIPAKAASKPIPSYLLPNGANGVPAKPPSINEMYTGSAPWFSLMRGK